MILDGLVVSAANAGFSNCFFGKNYFVGDGSSVHSCTNLVDLLLGIGPINSGGYCDSSPIRQFWGSARPLRLPLPLNVSFLGCCCSNSHLFGLVNTTWGIRGSGN